MQTPVSNLRIKEETTTKLEMQTPNRSWLLLFFSLFFMVLPTLLLVATIQLGRDQMVGVISFSIFLLMCLSFLFGIAFRSTLLVRSDLRTISLVRNYWLGFGAFGREREKSWSFSDIEDISISSTGAAKRMVIKTNNKKDLVLGFSFKARADGERLYDRLKSWVEGDPSDEFDIDETLTQLDEASQGEKTLKSIEKLLYFFAVFSLFTGGLDVLTVFLARMNNMSFGTDLEMMSLISFLAGIIYIACGIGVKKRIEGALWVAMIVIIIERFFGIAQAMLNGVELSSSVLFGLVVTFFLLSMLWNGVKEIRRFRELSFVEA